MRHRKGLSGNEINLETPERGEFNHRIHYNSHPVMTARLLTRHQTVLSMDINKTFRPLGKFKTTSKMDTVSLFLPQWSRFLHVVDLFQDFDYRGEFYSKTSSRTDISKCFSSLGSRVFLPDFYKTFGHRGSV